MVALTHPLQNRKINVIKKFIQQIRKTRKILAGKKSKASIGEKEAATERQHLVNRITSVFNRLQAANRTKKPIQCNRDKDRL